MDPFELLPLLDQQGEEIIQSGNDYYRPSFPLNLSTQSFVELFPIVINTFNKRIMTGLCYNISPYITKNNFLFDKKQIQELWLKFGELLPNVIEQPAFSGFLEGVSMLSLYYGKESKEFFKFLARSSEKFTHQAALILANSYQYINNDFFKYNTVFVCNLMIQNIETLTPSQHLSFVRMMDLFDYEKITPELEETFIYSLWKILFNSVEKAPGLAQEFAGALHKIYLAHPQLFNKENKYLSELFDDETNKSYQEWLQLLSNVIVFTPFFCFSDIEYLFHIFVSYEAMYMGETYSVHTKSLSALDSISGLFTHVQLNHILHILKDELSSANYPASIAIWSVIEFFLANFEEKSLNELIDAINLGFTNNYPLKGPLFYAIRNIANQLTHKHEEFISSLIPHIQESMAVAYGDAGVQAMHMMIDLLDADIFEARLSLWKIIDAGLNAAKHVIPVYFDYLVACARKINDQTEQDVTSIAVYLLGVAETAGLDGDIRNKALESISEVMEYYPKVLSETKGKIVPVLVELLEKYKDKRSAENVLSFIDLDKEDQLKNAVLKALNDKENQFRTKIAVTFAKICQESKSSQIFPLEIIDELLSSQDEMIFKRGIKCAAVLHKIIPSEKLNQIISKIVDYTKKSKSSGVVNASFRILKTVVDGLKDPNLPVNELIYCALQGRLAIFNHMPPFAFLDEAFSMYGAFSHFMSRFPSKSHHLMQTLIMWIPLVPNKVLPQLCKPLQIALDKEIMDESNGKCLYEMLLKRIVQKDYGQQPLIEAMQLSIDLADRFEKLPLMDLLSALEDVWDMYNDDYHTISYLGPAFLEVLLANHKEIDQRSGITQQIAKAIVSEDFDFDGPQMADLYIQLYDLQPKFCNPDADVAIVMTYYLTMDDEHLKEIGFDADTLQDMFEIFKQDLNDDKTIFPQLTNFINRKLPRASNRLKKLYGADKERPIFEKPPPPQDDNHCGCCHCHDCDDHDHHDHCHDCHCEGCHHH
ncbi:hypothetical protein TVAG_215130 [Trichomonas vaginalis G3]|uniref:TOG domain-containing protein n=1 Tax=Trichomonas vaginalis (strain ATCC PRA-98 / G3) TaxID=412133 RepID=A2F643_TRIV3|nr:armadillo (ARM) repeat-containing protein family [Trichomonas vaginalis G3]EAX99613.1 hypothetical protein TVAG_215130 [Trichomonas vaginalis G3]KAI5532129.1 armadillo (ARM) repeat-containing protein family [Trichomonas vaginalis G3]|eukprot:XP_001312543.1 hypothetical protein [Trichomonas vaginalis G3]